MLSGGIDIKKTCGDAKVPTANIDKCEEAVKEHFREAVEAECASVYSADATLKDACKSHFKEPWENVFEGWKGDSRFNAFAMKVGQSGLQGMRPAEVIEDGVENYVATLAASAGGSSAPSFTATDANNALTVIQALFDINNPAEAPTLNKLDVLVNACSGNTCTQLGTDLANIYNTAKGDKAMVAMMVGYMPLPVVDGAGGKPAEDADEGDDDDIVSNDPGWFVPAIYYSGYQNKIGLGTYDPAFKGARDSFDHGIGLTLGFRPFESKRLEFGGSIKWQHGQVEPEDEALSTDKTSDLIIPSIYGQYALVKDAGKLFTFSAGLSFDFYIPTGEALQGSLGMSDRWRTGPTPYVEGRLRMGEKGRCFASLRAGAPLTHVLSLFSKVDTTIDEKDGKRESAFDFGGQEGGVPFMIMAGAGCYIGN